MDVGKAFLAPELLARPGAYSPEDWAEMRRHPALGADAVKASGDMSKIVADVCLHHHERHDGSGYPHGLQGEHIPLSGRIVTVADVLPNGIIAIRGEKWMTLNTGDELVRPGRFAHSIAGKVKGDQIGLLEHVLICE